MMSEPSSPTPPERQELMPSKAMWHRFQKYPYLLARFTLYSAILLLVYVCFHAVDSVMFPLLLSMLMAYLLDPVIDWFEEQEIDRTMAISIVVLGLIVAFGIFTAFLYPLVAKQIITVISKLPTFVDSVQEDLIPWVQQRFAFELPPTFADTVSKYSQEIKAAAPTVLNKVALWGTGLVTQTGVIVISLLNLIMIPVFTFYFLRDFDIMRLEAAEYVPEHSKSFVFSRLRMIDEVVGAWFRGQIQVGLILAVLYGIGLALSFWLTGHSAFDGLALGVITGVLNVIPYVGFAVGAVLSILVVLIEWTGWGALLGVVVVFIFVQGLEGYVITPKIVGEKVGLSPVTVIIVLLLGGELAGLLGVLLSIPVAGAVKVVWPDIRAYYMSTTYFRGVDVLSAWEEVLDVDDEQETQENHLNVRDLVHDEGFMGEAVENASLEDAIVEEVSVVDDSTPVQDSKGDETGDAEHGDEDGDEVTLTPKKDV